MLQVDLNQIHQEESFQSLDLAHIDLNESANISNMIYSEETCDSVTDIIPLDNVDSCIVDEHVNVDEHANVDEHVNVDEHANVETVDKHEENEAISLISLT
jgi:hypothetical protein